MATPTGRNLLFLCSLFVIACGSNNATNPTPGAGGSAGGTTGQAGSSGGGTGGGSAGTGGSGDIIVPTPEGTLFMDDFESGVAKWDVTQGTCSALADGTTVFNCINGGNEARALAGDIGWGEYSVQARVKVNAMDTQRWVCRIHLFQVNGTSSLAAG